MRKAETPNCKDGFLGAPPVLWYELTFSAVYEIFLVYLDASWRSHERRYMMRVALQTGDGQLQQDRMDPEALKNLSPQQKDEIMQTVQEQVRTQNFHLLMLF